jgi:hypothetical protein
LRQPAPPLRRLGVRRRRRFHGATTISPMPPAPELEPEPEPGPAPELLPELEPEPGPEPEPVPEPDPPPLPPPLSWEPGLAELNPASHASARPNASLIYPFQEAEGFLRPRDWELAGLWAGRLASRGHISPSSGQSDSEGWELQLAAAEARIAVFRSLPALGGGQAKLLNELDPGFRTIG